MNKSLYLRNLFPKQSSALLSLLCAGLVIFGVAGFICFRQFESAKNSALNADNTASNLVATVLAEHEKASRGVLLSYAERPLLIKAVKEKDLAAVHSHIKGMKRNNPEIDLIFLTDKDGTIWANYPVYPEAIGQNVSDRDWYRGVSARWEPYTSSVFQLIVGDKPLAIATAVPAVDEKGEVIGILGNSRRLDFMANAIQNTYLNPDTTVNVLDQIGKLLFSNKYLFTDKVTDYPLFSVVQQAIKGNEHLIEATEQSGSDGKTYLTRYPVEQTGWTVVVERRHEDILRSAYRGFFEIGTIAILLFSLAGSFVFYQRKVVLLRRTEDLLHAEQKLRESEQAELETRIKAEQEIKKAEKSLRDGEERLRFALETNHTGAWDLDLVDHTAFRSLEHDRIFGYATLLPQWTYEMFLEHVLTEDRAPVNAKFRHAIETRSDWNFECRIRRTDGAVRWIAAAGRHYADAAGTPRRMAGIVQDITERKRAEEKLRLSEESLRQANEGLEQRVQERTTELKQRADQLARLSSQLTMTEQDERKRLSKILHDGLQQYLVAAKMQMGGLIDRASDAALKQAAIELENLLGETITVSRSLAVELSPPILHEAGLISGLQWLSRWMCDKHGLKVELVLQTETPMLTADVKVLLFESVREHLLNIVKHANTFSARVELSQEDGRSLRLTVSDNGQGFDPASIPNFGDTGGGFGLFSIRERINLIGGRFEIDSSPGKGARFTLTVPLAVNEPLEPMPSALPTRLDGAVEARFPRPEGKIRILLADDHSVMREGLARLLSHEADFEIVGQANDGQEAVDLAGRLDPDVILMDISMPRLDGIDAARSVHQQHPHIRIIGLSLYKEEERAKEMLDAGAVFYLTKTGPAIELKTAIRSSMRDRQINEKPSPRP